MKNFKWTKLIKSITDRLGKDWRFIGGCVRDSLLNIETKDIDIVTLKTPDEILTLTKGLNITEIGKRFGTIGIFYKDWKIEITTARLDVENFGRKANVKFLNSKDAFFLDSERRDFTINAMSYDGKNLYDYHNGLKDLSEKRVRFVGNAEERIKEDYLRIIRYIRFFIRFGKRVSYIKIFKKNLDGLKFVSIERIISEIEKMVIYDKFSKSISLLNKIGISEKIFGKLLNDKIPKNIDKIKKIALVFKDFNIDEINKLNINRESKKLLKLDFIGNNFFDKTLDRFLLNISIIWTKNIDLAKNYLSFAELKYKRKLEIKYFPDKFEENQVYIGKERGIKEIMSRYNFLKKHVIARSRT